MKRPREDLSSDAGREGANSAIAASNQLEILQGLTARRSARYRVPESEGELLFETEDFRSLSSSSSAFQTPLLLMVDYLAHSLSSPPSPNLPIRIEIVQLVANDAHTLVCRPTPLPMSSAAGPVTLSVDPEVGKELAPGDVVVAYADGETTYRVTFLAIQISSLTDTNTWADAVDHNGLAVLQWVTSLLACRPGLEQLTFLYQSATEDGSRWTGWRRALQLPKLLRPSLLERLALTSQGEPRVGRVYRTVLSTLSALTLVLKNSQSQMVMPHLLKKILVDFLSSSLFVDGFLLMLSPQAQMLLAPSELHSAVDTLKDIVQFAVPLLSKWNPCVAWHTYTEAASAAQAANNRALDGLLAVLNRLAVVGRSILNKSDEIIGDAINGLIRAGFVRWLNEWIEREEKYWEEQPGTEAGATLTTSDMLERAHLPPSLAMIEEEAENHSERRDAQRRMRRSITTLFDALPHLAAMRSTYDPVRTMNALPFVESGILAAYAELYGPVARRMNSLLKLWDNKKTDIHSASAVALPIVAGSHRQRDLGDAGRPFIGNVSLGQLQHTALFGSPLHLTWALIDEKAKQVRDAARQLLESSSTAASQISSNGVSTGSLIGYVVVRAAGMRNAFPVILTEMTDESCTVHSMRDGDLLHQFISTLAPLGVEGGVWLIVGPMNDDGAESPRDADPLHGAPPRLFPEGTPCLTYLHFIRRLQRMRNDMLSSTRARSTQASEGEKSENGMWLNFFGTKNLPHQRYHNSVQPNAISVLEEKGGGARRGHSSKTLQEVLRDLGDFANLTPQQREALHYLTDNHQATSSATGMRTGGPLLSSLRVVEGAEGSGKSLLLHAAGLAKGLQLEEARMEQKSGLAKPMERCEEALRSVAQRIRSARSLEEAYTADARRAGEPGDLVAAASARAEEFERLFLGLRYCSVPMLVRSSNSSISSAPCRTAREGEGLPSFASVLFGIGNADDEESAGVVGRPPWLSVHKFHSVLDVVESSLSRCANPPLGKSLAARLTSLMKVASFCSAVLSAAEEDKEEEDAASSEVLYASLLPCVMSRFEQSDTQMSAAAADMSWREYVTDQLWSAVPGGVRDAADGAWGDGCWTPVNFSREPFSPVDIIAKGLTPLSELTSEQAAGWHSVYQRKQIEFVKRLYGLVHEAMRHVVVLYEDLVYGVASMLQTVKHCVLTCTTTGLLQDSLLPFLWRWNPAHLLFDDFDSLTDGLLLTLPSPNTLTVSASFSAPLLLSQRQTAPRVILKDLRNALEKHSAARTTYLSETHRCQRAELHAILTRWAQRKMQTIAPAPAGEDVLGPLVHPTPLAGLASHSSVEGWSHAVPLPHTAEADTRAAMFLLSRFRQHSITDSQTIRIFFPFREDLEEARAKQSVMDPDGTLRCVPFHTLEMFHSDEETDIAIACLSSLDWRLSKGGEMNTAKQQTPSWWDREEIQEENGLLEQRLKCWLWLVASKTRLGIVVVGSRRLYNHLPSMRHLERFIVEKRETLAPRDEGEAIEIGDVVKGTFGARDYWLPPEVGCSTMAFQCPQHYKCRSIAWIHYKDHKDGEMKSGVQVIQRGSLTCESLCLLPYEGCSCPFHVCLQPCHHLKPSGSGDGAEEGDALQGNGHNSCPHPCIKKLRCGHLCLSKCGETGANGSECPPCRVNDLTQLSCGQRVLSGTADGRLLFNVFPHFQEHHCGEPPLPCELPVTVVCRRCSTKSTVCCAVLQGIKEVRWREALERAGEGAPPSREEVDRDTEDSLLGEMNCRGCVALLNKVAAEVPIEDFVPLPLPPEHWEPTGEDEEGEEERISPAHHLLSAAGAPIPEVFFRPDVQPRKDFAFSREARKAALLQRKEALEIASGYKASDSSLFSIFKAKYAEQCAVVEMNRTKRDAESEKADAQLLEKLRVAYEEQIKANVGLEALMPQLITESRNEFERQMDA